jgi:ferredoxin
MPKITFVNEKQDLEVPAGSNLRQQAIKANIGLYPGLAKYLNCRGLGSCGTCKVLVKKGMENLSPMGLYEKVRLALMPFATIGHEHEMRLACQTTVNGDCTVQTRPAIDLEGENFWQKPWPNK